MEKNKVRARFTRFTFRAGRGAPRGPRGRRPREVPGAAENRRPPPGIGEGRGWEGVPWPPELSRDGGGRGGTAAGEEHTPPEPPCGVTVTLATHGRRGQDGVPEGRSQPQLLSRERGTGGGQACRSAGRALLPAAVTRDSPALCPEALPGRAASHSGARRRGPQHKRSDAKTPPGKVAACRKYFTREFSPSLPRRSSAPGRWRRAVPSRAEPAQAVPSRAGSPEQCWPCRAVPSSAGSAKPCWSCQAVPSRAGRAKPCWPC